MTVKTGDTLDLAHFGPAIVRKIYKHGETGESVADVYVHSCKTSMHLSMKYATQRIAA